MNKVNKSIVFRTKLFVVLFFTVAYSLYGQKTTNNNYTGSWATNASWVDNAAPAFTGISVNFFVNGYITLGSPAPAAASNMTFRSNPDQSGLAFTLNDTLVVHGSLTMGNNAMDLVIGPGGFLIVFGDLTVGNMMDVNSTGNIIVTGTFTKQGAANQGSYTGGGNIYAGNIDAPGSWIPAENKKNTGSDLENDFPDIFDFISNGGNSPLPVEILFFNASLLFDHIELSWATASEVDFDYFEIQRSDNADDFTPIGSVVGKGSAGNGANYTTIDNNPVLGRSYYRLKAIDLDGTYEYFGMVVIDYQAEKKVSVYPNPFRGEVLNVNANFELNDVATVQIISNAGKILYQSESNSSISSLQIGNSIGRGIYIVRFIYQTEVFTQRLIIN